MLFTAEEDTALAVNISHGVYIDIHEEFVPVLAYFFISINVLFIVGLSTIFF